MDTITPREERAVYEGLALDDDGAFLTPGAIALLQEAFPQNNEPPNNNLDQKWRFQPLDPNDRSRVYVPPGGRDSFLQGNDTTPPRPMRVAVITSVRDVGRDDHVGTYLMSNDDSSYMKGTAERLLEAEHNELRGLVQIVGIIVDDKPSDNLTTSDGKVSYTVLPEKGKQWIIPERQSGPLMEAEQIVGIPSAFRGAGLSLEERAIQKRQWEEDIAAQAKKWGADIILSDHCMVIFNHLHRDLFPGRVVNIHPAIAFMDDPDRVPGATPTEDAIKRFSNLEITHTGATFHFVNDVADAGNCIRDSKTTQITNDLPPRLLRLKNYNNAKHPVVIAGLIRLAQNYPFYVTANQVALGLRPQPVFDLTPANDLTPAAPEGGLVEVGKEVHPFGALNANGGGKKEDSHPDIKDLHRLVASYASSLPDTPIPDYKAIASHVQGAEGAFSNTSTKFSFLKPKDKGDGKAVTGFVLYEAQEGKEPEEIAYVAYTPIHDRKGRPAVVINEIHAKEGRRTHEVTELLLQEVAKRNPEALRLFLSIAPADKAGQQLLNHIVKMGGAAPEGVVTLTESLSSLQKHFKEVAYRTRVIEPGDIDALKAMNKQNSELLLDLDEESIERLTELSDGKNSVALVTIDEGGTIKAITFASRGVSLLGNDTIELLHPRTPDDTSHEEKKEIISSLVHSISDTVLDALHIRGRKGSGLNVAWTLGQYSSQNANTTTPPQPSGSYTLLEKVMPPSGIQNVFITNGTVGKLRKFPDTDSIYVPQEPTQAKLPVARDSDDDLLPEQSDGGASSSSLPKHAAAAPVF